MVRSIDIVHELGFSNPSVSTIYGIRLLAAEAIVGAAALLIVELFPQQLIGIFGAANERAYYTDYAIKCFRVYLCMMPLAAVNKGTFIYLQSLGKALCIHSHLHGARGAVRRGVCPAAPHAIWSGRSIVFYASLRPSDVFDLSGGDCLYLPDAGF